MLGAPKKGNVGKSERLFDRSVCALDVWMARRRTEEISMANSRFNIRKLIKETRKWRELV